MYIIINNNQEIMGLYDNLNTTLNIVLDNFILHFESTIEILKQNNFFKLSHINNTYKIKEIIINSNIINKEIYFCFKKFLFYDNDKLENYLNNDNYSFRNKVNKIKNLYNKIISQNKDVNNDFNIFIPNDIFDNDSNSNNIFEDTEKNKNELLEKIKKLEEEENTLTESNNLFNEKKKNLNKSITEKINNNNKIENKIKEVKDKNKEVKNKFNCNLKVYNQLKDKINSNEMEIPEIFEEDFKIFKYLDENKINDNDEMFEYYKNNIKQVLFFDNSYNNLFKD